MIPDWPRSSEAIDREIYELELEGFDSCRPRSPKAPVLNNERTFCFLCAINCIKRNLQAHIEAREGIRILLLLDLESQWLIIE